MTLDIAQSMALLIIGILAIVILLRILMIVHRQAGRFKELEQRMKAMETSDALTSTETKDNERSE